MDSRTHPDVWRQIVVLGQLLVQVELRDIKRDDFVEESRAAIRNLERELEHADGEARDDELRHREQSRRMLRDLPVTSLHAPRYGRRKRRTAKG